MSEIEKIERYIECTPVNDLARYDMNFPEALAISSLKPMEAITLAFNYGRAKGCRAAKAVSHRK